MFLDGIPINSQIEALIIMDDESVYKVNTTVKKIVKTQVPSIAIELYLNGRRLVPDHITSISIYYYASYSLEAITWNDVVFVFDSDDLYYVIGSRYEGHTEDRRSSYRVPSGDLALVSSAKAPGYVNCTIFDISRTGIAFVTSALSDANIGDEIKIKFYDADTSSTLKLKCCIKNKASLSDGVYRYGCSFSSEYPEFIRDTYLQRKRKELGPRLR